MLKICNPKIFQGVMSLLLANDSQFIPDKCLVYAFSVFGELFVWHPDYHVIRIDLLRYHLSAIYLFNSGKKNNPNVEITSYLVTFEGDQYDVDDISGKPLYTRAVKKLGEPGRDSVLGLFLR